MQTHDLKRATPNQSKKRVGRGGTRGKTSGKGHKGQGQHGSSNGRPVFRDLIKKLPKLRGHGVNRAQTVNDSVKKPFPVNVSTLEVFESGALVSPQTLEEKGVISRSGGRLPKVKILGDGELTKKLTVISCQVSASAKEKIEKAGGKVKA